MKVAIFQLMLSCFLLIVSGCSSSMVISEPLKAQSDYRIRGIYTLKSPVFLFKYNKDSPKEIAKLEKLGFSGTATDLLEFKKRAPDHPQVAGLLVPGDRLTIKSLVMEKSVTIGNFLVVYAVIDSGDFRGVPVDISMVSKGGLSSNAFIDSNYLELTK